MSKTTIDLAALKAVVVDDLRRLRRDYVFAFGFVLAIGAIAALVQTIGTAFSRMAYPFALEWMEGGVVDHVRIVLAGKPLYRAPSFEWTPFIYPPFYYWVCAAFMKVFGVSLFWARFVSTCSMIGAFALVGAFVRREVGGLVGPIVAAGLFAITFKITGLWMDLARVDSLFVALFLGGAYLARFGDTPVKAALGGLLLFLGFFTKQTGLVLAAPVLVTAVWLDRRRGLIVAGTFAGLTIGAVQWMDLASDDWFRYYVFEVARKHATDWTEWHRFFVETFWQPMPITLAFAIFALACGALRGGRAVLFFYASLLFLTWVHAFSGMIHNGGYLNALIPYCALLSLLAGVAIGWITKQEVTGRVLRRLQAVGVGLLMLQLGMLIYDQRPAIPRRRDVATGKLMIDRWRRARAQHGPVLSLGFGYYGMLAGDPEIHAHTMALSDIFKTADPKYTVPLTEDLQRVLQSRRYRTIIRDESFSLVPGNFDQTLRTTYRQQGALFEPGEDDRVWPPTAFHCRPNELWTVP